MPLIKTLTVRPECPGSVGMLLYVIYYSGGENQVVNVVYIPTFSMHGSYGEY